MMLCPSQKSKFQNSYKISFPNNYRSRTLGEDVLKTKLNRDIKNQREYVMKYYKSKLQVSKMWYREGNRCQVRIIEHVSSHQLRSAQFILSHEQYEPMKKRLALCTYDEAYEHLLQHAKPYVSERRRQIAEDLNNRIPKMPQKPRIFELESTIDKLPIHRHGSNVEGVN